VNSLDVVIQQKNAQLVGVSEPAVSGLVDRGIIFKGDTAAMGLLPTIETKLSVSIGFFNQKM
jgi:hypothetical protein